MLHEPVGNIRRELLRWSKAGLLFREKVGNLTYYSLNTSFPLYEELKQIVSKTIGIEYILREGLKEIESITVAIIYGSVASGEDTGNSDIDILLIGNPDMDELLNNVQEMEKKLGREINYVVYTPEEFKRKKEAKNTFIIDVVRNPKVFIVGEEHDL
ncbi:MAG: nucleotidyltransferase domain-containing protein [Deltaproteobacteria bacterium]|nr:nucleotidyltransferase domain-containing protein [Deltaproteobacteria bacterium]